MTVLLTAAAGVLAGAGAASATVTTLCTGYSGCARVGLSDDGYSKVSSRMYWRMYSGHNCTNYAAYRMVRSGLANTRPWSGGGNATYWGTSMSRITTSTPSVGAVAWWKARVYPAGSAGHVAYVEKVVSADEIIVSMDSWHGDFSWARITRASKGWPSGFVHFNDARLLNTALPKVAGTTKVGSQLTASAGAWSVPGPTLAYQWQADGASIPGATGTTLTLSRAQQGKRITVQVTASLLGYPTASAVSAASTAVRSGVLSNGAAPTIVGEPRVGATLDARAGSWSPTPTQVDYQWRADGAPVAGATADHLELGPSLAGKAISVTATARRNGYEDVSRTSAATAAVRPGVLRVSTPPTIEGSARPGETLTVLGPDVDRHTSVSVQWFRAGKAVPGATSTDYPVTTADLGSRLRVDLRLTRPGYLRGLARTVSTAVVRSTPQIRLSTRGGHRRLTFTAIVSADGVGPVPGVVQVRSHGRVLREVPLRDGVARARLTGLHRGRHTYRFRVPTSAQTTSAVVKRRLRIG